MTITISLNPDEERRLLERAAQSGQDLPGYIHRLIERDLNSASREAGAAPTLDEVLAPVREDFRQSGMTEEDLGALVDEAREEVWQEKHGRASSAS